MADRKTLFYFSNCALQGDKLNPFLQMELPWLQKHFDEVWIVAADCLFSAQDWCLQTGLPAQAVKRKRFTSMHLLRALGSAAFWQETKHLLAQRQWSPVAWLKLLAFTVRAQRMRSLADGVLRTLPAENSRTVFYSCWMSYDGYAAALCKKSRPQAYSVARCHAFDIDTERNAMNPYLHKRFMAQTLDCICPISESAKAQLMAYAAAYLPPSKVQVIPFGSAGEAVPLRSDSPCHRRGAFHIISCAHVLPIKQVELLADALDGWCGLPIHWTHVGGGEGLTSLQQRMDRISEHNDRLICECAGALTPQELDMLYQNRDFDVFINTSKKEGVPVSVMEAMRYSIPVIAPHVGGLPEIVNSDNGFLFSPNSCDSLKEALLAMTQLPEEKLRAMRTAAANTWQERYQNSRQLPKLFAGML